MIGVLKCMANHPYVVGVLAYIQIRVQWVLEGQQQGPRWPAVVIGRAHQLLGEDALIGQPS